MRRAELPDHIEAPLRDEKLLRLDEALARLEVEDPAKAELVKLRYFGGLPLREIAELLDISVSTADRYWAYTRTCLQGEMS